MTAPTNRQLLVEIQNTQTQVGELRDKVVQQNGRISKIERKNIGEEAVAQYKLANPAIAPTNIGDNTTKIIMAIVALLATLVTYLQFKA